MIRSKIHRIALAGCRFSAERHSVPFFLGSPSRATLAYGFHIAIAGDCLRSFWLTSPQPNNVGSRKLRHGFTLVELVVVLTILGLAAGIVTLRFAGPLREARVRGAMEQWRATDQFARQSHRSGQITVSLQSLQNRTLVTVQTETGQVLRRWPIDAPMSIEIATSNGGVTDKLIFNAWSGSPDYRINIRESNYVRSLDFAGGTGSVRSDKSK